MPFAVVLILLVVGSILFHLLSPWYFTELASNWAMVDVTMDITFYVTGFVFVSRLTCLWPIASSSSATRRMHAPPTNPKTKNSSTG